VERAHAGGPAGTPGAGRRAPVVADDDPEAVATVAALIDSFGFDPLEISPLSEGWRIQRDTPGYVHRLTKDELRIALGQAKRYRDM
jgi:8-hydroxy-5-deazaflavin:NADPH oxidoreductase